MCSLTLLPFLQDTLCLVAPYLFCLEPLKDFHQLTASDSEMTGCDDVWFTLQQLFFRAAYAPLDRWKTRPLIWRFLHIRTNISLYKLAASQLPTLYVCQVENIHCCVQLMSCYLQGNLHNTISHSLCHAVPAGATADFRQYSRTGYKLFKVNIWMWLYGREFTRKISVEDAQDMLWKSVQEARQKELNLEDWQKWQGRQNFFFCRNHI